MPGVHGELVALAADLAALHLGGSADARSAPRSTHCAKVASSSSEGSTSRKPFIGLAPWRPNSLVCGSFRNAAVSSGIDPHAQLVLAHDADGHVAADHPAHPAEHLAFDHARPGVDHVADPLRQALVVGHRGILWYLCPVSKLTGYERSAILWLLFGGFLFGIGWVIGLFQLWGSGSWTTVDKLIGTLLWPGGLATGFFLFALVLGDDPLSIVFGLLVPIATAIHLALRATRGR